MPTVRFTANIQRHVACPDLEVEGGSVRTALNSYFQSNPDARGYVLDETGTPRRHMTIFLNGRQVLDRDGLTDPVDTGDTIDIMQALSGG